MRLIDADLYKRRLMEFIPNNDVAFDILDDMPSIEIIHCEECERRGTELCAMHYECRCGRTVTWAGDGEFCSYGERKE